MSTESNMELIATYESLLFTHRASCAIAALGFYEYLITLEYEIDFLWRRRWTAATWIFQLNRYSTLAYAITTIAPYSPQICNQSQIMNVVVSLTFRVSTISAEVFTVLRIFAILQDRLQRLIATWILVILGLLLVAIELHNDLTAIWRYDDDPVLGSSCNQVGYSGSSNVTNFLFETDAVIAIASSLFVLVITFMKTARQVRQASTLGLETTFSEILLRDGSVFFFSVLLGNIIVAIPTPNTAGSIINALSNLLSCILLSRFVINLRQVDSPNTNSSAHRHPSRFSMPNFRVPTMDDIVGNLGEPLDFTEYPLDEDAGLQDGALDDDATANAGERQDPEDVISQTTRIANVEAGHPSGSGSGSGIIDPEIQVVDRAQPQELEHDAVLLRLV